MTDPVNLERALESIDYALPILERYRETTAELRAAEIEGRDPDWDRVDWDSLTFAHNNLADHWLGLTSND